MASTRSDGGSDDDRVTKLMEKVKILEEEVKWNRSKINVLDAKTQKPFVPGRTSFSVADETAIAPSVTDESGVSEDYMVLRHKRTIPKVRECTFAKFKNRFHAKGKDGRYAVDVLSSGMLMNQEIAEEHKLRDKLFAESGPKLATAIIKEKTLAKAVENANLVNNLIEEAQAEEKWPRRIRIQSPALLRILGRVNEENWTDRPRTYYRPFNSLIYQHKRMQKELERLEDKYGSQVPDEDAYETESSDDDADDETEDSDDEEESDDEEGEGEGSDDDDDDDDDENAEDSPKALACVRAYMKYMDAKIMPDYRRFETMDVDSDARVRFSDLWYLFRTGELVYQQVDGELPDRRDFRTGKRIWRTYYVDPVPERLTAAVTDNLENRDAALTNDDHAFTIGMYYVDHTGEGFCVVKKRVRIDQFAGEKPVGALPVYPMRFCVDWKGRLKHAVFTGNQLLEFIKAKHCSYNGWTLIQSPSGEPTTDADGKEIKQPDHVNSEVIVDFKEAFQACPAWRPQRATMRQKLVEGLTVQEEFRIRWWSGRKRTKLLGETMEQIPVRSGVAAKERNEFVSNDPFLVAMAENDREMLPTTEKDLNEDTKALLTGRVFAYVFQERKFAQLAVAKLRLAPKTALALDALRIFQPVKDTLQGAIQGHFLQKEAAENNPDQDWSSLDMIQGKGTGLFILLHGVPGVGKTATAEAIAQANGKPLFKITAGDLGMTPENLETSLRDIFRLASSFNCILLLDEVDTFFSARTKSGDGTDKNALVSVFLRVLDYYDGVLFLTTNRPGVLDEAFISRLNFTAYFPHLTIEQTIDIWKLNIKRVQEIDKPLAQVQNRGPIQLNEDVLLSFAQWIFHYGGGQGGPACWNGRQIRNAFQVARNMAYYEHSKGLEQWIAIAKKGAATPTNSTDGSHGDEHGGIDKFPPPTLTVRHFKTTHRITDAFMKYLNAVRGGTIAAIAREAEFRADNLLDPLTKQWQEDYRNAHYGDASSTVAGGDDESAEETCTTGKVTESTRTVSVTETQRAIPVPQHQHQHHHHQQQSQQQQQHQQPWSRHNQPHIQQHMPNPQQNFPDNEDLSSSGNNFPQGPHVHRNSLGAGTRHRSNSSLSNPGGVAGSPPARENLSGFEPNQIYPQQQSRFPPAHSPHLGGFNTGNGGLDPNYNYFSTRGQQYPSGYYGSSPGGTRSINAMTPRRASPALHLDLGGGGSVPSQAYSQADYYNPGSGFTQHGVRDNSLGLSGQVTGRHGSAGGMASGQGFQAGDGNQFLGTQIQQQMGRTNPGLGQGQEQLLESDLSLDD
ncbi:hypothetical protein B0H63DRAFT_192775 [Podospora didyma]|uniref:AAA+ ATPase domain-containing protein n=1 Tax=Podospora didyma TaxID=330526 RepID=A0AAE0U0B1_9PEZI|nr:hypothetical protein B0H63DRAFT_192775 [Podospora didyma]